MQALCFQCGAEKPGPFKLCSQCLTAPQSQEDLLLSLCLSRQCVEERSLRVCKKYFKRKKHAPRFREHVIELATEILSEFEQQLPPDSIEFSSALFDFKSLSFDEPESS